MNILEIVIISLIKIIIIVVMLLLTVAYSVYFERKISAWVQNRVGPNRVGWHGLLQPFADVFKLLLKEDIVPTAANKPLHTLAPFIALFVAFATYAVIPIGPPIELFGYKINLVVADVNIGVLYVFALTSLGVYGITFAGWSSGSKYSLLGGIRSSAQMISYEVSMGFSIAGVLLFSQSLSPVKIVQAQSGWMWNAILQPIGFITFVVSAFAETNRLPFDLPEAEPELVGGYHTEYSSMKLGFYLFAEYINMFISSAMISTLYFGGYNFPFMNNPALSVNAVGIIGTFVLFLKISFFGFLYMWVRWTLPRFRYDQLMNLGWKKLIPVAVLNMIITGLCIMIFK